jgi:tRNA (cmo5U34)-methyltransferase
VSVQLIVNKKDEIIAGEKWAFDENVTEVFDNMLERSIPDYPNMRSLVTALVQNYQTENSYVMDLGCSTGGAIQDAIDSSFSSTKFAGLEISKPMLDKARFKLRKYIQLDKVEITECDLRSDFPKYRNSVVLSILTLQFIPIEYRQQIITNVFNSLESGGAFVLVEKILGDDSAGNQILEKLYYQMKGENGYTEEQIKTKRKSLEGVLVPVTSTWNEDMMYKSGFKSVQKFWQQLNFAGWVAFK